MASLLTPFVVESVCMRARAQRAISAQRLSYVPSPTRLHPWFSSAPRGSTGLPSLEGLCDPRRRPCPNSRGFSSLPGVRVHALTICSHCCVSPRRARAEPVSAWCVCFGARGPSRRRVVRQRCRQREEGVGACPLGVLLFRFCLS